MELGDLPIYAAAGLTLAWGLFLLMAVVMIVRDLGPLEAPGPRIVAMAWVAQALGLAFVGGLIAFLIEEGQAQAPAFKHACLACAAYLGALGLVSAATGARSGYLLLRMTPLVHLASAALLALTVF